MCMLPKIECSRSREYVPPATRVFPLMFSFIFGYFAFMYLTGRMKTGTQMFDRPPLSWLMFSVVFTALVIALQRVFLRMLVRLSAPLSGRTESEEKRLATDLAALSYA